MHNEAYMANQDCVKYATEVLPGQPNITNANLATSVSFTCNVLTACDMPWTSSDLSCVLTGLWAPQPVPADRATALCTNPAYPRNGTDASVCDYESWAEVRAVASPQLVSAVHRHSFSLDGARVSHTLISDYPTPTLPTALCARE